MSWESSDLIRFDLGPFLQGQRGYPNLKVLITCLLLVLLEGEMGRGRCSMLRNLCGLYCTLEIFCKNLYTSSWASNKFEDKINYLYQLHFCK